LAATGTADAAADAAVSAAGAAASVASGAAAYAKHEAACAANTAAATAATAAATAATAAAKAGELKEYASDEARRVAYQQLGKGVEMVMAKVERFLYRQVVDPDMPPTVQRGVQALVASLTDELDDTLLEKAAGAVLRSEADGGGTEPAFCGCFGVIRAFVLYHLMPWDKSIWAKMRDPVWCVALLIGSMPLLGVRVAWWVFVFLLLDHHDEFTLCNFVVTFKASHFVSGCFVAALSGTTTYMACNEAGDCHEAGPGVSLPAYEADLCAVLVQSLCCWVAMAFLPWATPKGGKLYKVSKKLDSHELAATKGGRLWYLVS
jgi:hypothetical protein